MKKKLNKKELLVSTSEPLYVRHPKNEKHNEVTVVVLNLAMPLKPIISFLNPEMLKAFEEVSVGFPDANLRFNFKPDTPAILFTVKGKTECRGNDVPNQKIGDMVALAKAQAAAGVIASRVTKAMAKVIEEALTNVVEVKSYFESFSAQERIYVAEEKYLKVLEKAKI